jgi:hypothetical protein
MKNFYRLKEYGGIGDFDTVTRSLHRSGAIPSHFVSTLHRQRKFSLLFYYYNNNRLVTSMGNLQMFIFFFLEKR